MCLKMLRRKKFEDVIKRLRNGCLITFKKLLSSHRRCSIKKLFLKASQYWTKVASGKCSVK